MQFLLNWDFWLWKHFYTKLFVLIAPAQVYIQLSENIFGLFVPFMENFSLF